ncbi:adenine phosphoribosyltransferase [Treponema endosymbiont of Eucomonympha sp.]|uniref:adenine phosphoribosyltransferase n=1 Tax=Treponema endosymbiont of Eucomonympha sp. TaxID=1580831 RepID=UPI0007864869|nr:adenine phosphoribosyltransferase [Treponema endosymbiont of Eucomonympha sp.]
MEKPEVLDRAIRRVRDFPKPGILFYDINGILVNPEAFAFCVERLTELCREVGAEMVVGVEARGFVFAAPVAERLRLPLVLVRKKGRLPSKSYTAKYSLEYGEAEVEVCAEDVRAGQKVAVVDDLIATGGTLQAARSVLEQGGARVVGYFGVIGLPSLNYAQTLAPLPVTTLINYESE